MHTPINDNLHSRNLCLLIAVLLLNEKLTQAPFLSRSHLHSPAVHINSSHAPVFLSDFIFLLYFSFPRDVYLEQEASQQPRLALRTRVEAVAERKDWTINHPNVLPRIYQFIFMFVIKGEYTTVIPHEQRKENGGIQDFSCLTLIQNTWTLFLGISEGFISGCSLFFVSLWRIMHFFSIPLRSIASNLFVLTGTWDGSKSLCLAAFQTCVILFSTQCVCAVILYIHV